MSMVEIVMDGPGKNCLSLEMLQFLRAQLKQAGGKPVLLTGSGDAFSAGLHLKQLAQLTRDEMLAFLVQVEGTFTDLYLYPGPTVALVNGHAIAGGAVLTLCCDHRVAVDDPRAKFGLNEVALGVLFPPRTLAMVRQRAPERAILGGGLFDPQTALRLGMLDEVSPDAGRLARTRLLELASHPAIAYARTKAALRGTRPEDIVSDEEQIRGLEEALPAWTSPETRERILAVLKR